MFMHTILFSTIFWHIQEVTEFRYLTPVLYHVCPSVRGDNQLAKVHGLSPSTDEQTIQLLQYEHTHTVSF